MTGIQWTDETWNPVTGCNKVSPGCAHCYAEGIAKRFWGDREFSDVQFHPERLGRPRRWRKPRLVFVNSMSDLFHDAVAFDQIAACFGIMAATPRHSYQILTKRPEQMLKFFDWIASFDCPWTECLHQLLTHDPSGVLYTNRPWPLPNVWLGVTAENQRTADERIPLLLQTPATVKFLSCEPLLEEIDLGLKLEEWPDTVPWNSRWVFLPQPVRGDLFFEPTVAKPGCYRAKANQHGALSVPAHDGQEKSFLGIKPNEFESLGTVDWVIVGGESGPKARPCDWAWVESVAEQCRGAKVPCFVKQAGSNSSLAGITGKGGNPLEWPRPMPREFPL